MNPRRYPLRAITLSVVVMHAAALAWIDMAPAKPAQPLAGGSKHRVMQTRLAQIAKPAPASPAPTVLASALADTGTWVAPRPTPATAPTPAPTAAPDLPAATPLADNRPPADAPQPQPTELAAEDNGDAYLPRPLLSSAPRPTAPVLMPFPAQVTEPGRYATILALFIDEGGVVRRVRIDGPALPKVMEDTAKATFLQTHFRPGEANGQQVKSLIRVEVVFDNTSTNSREASRSL